MIGFGMGFGLLFLVLIFGGVILMALWLVKSLFPASQKPSGFPTEGEPTAQEILERRYARGELTREQYELMKLDLRN